MKSREEEEQPGAGEVANSPSKIFTDQSWTASEAPTLGRPPAVTFFDGQHMRWRVYERDAQNDPGAHGEYCLVFISGDTVRRVWTYPTDWQELTSTELSALSWKT